MDAFFCCSFFPFIRDSHTSANSNTEKQKKEEARFEKYPSLCFKIVSLALRSWLTSSSLEVRKVHQRDRSMAFTFFPFPFSITALAVGVCPTDIAWHQFTTGKYMLPLSFFFFFVPSVMWTSRHRRRAAGQRQAAPFKKEKQRKDLFSASIFRVRMHNACYNFKERRTDKKKEIVYFNGVKNGLFFFLKPNEGP